MELLPGDCPSDSNPCWYVGWGFIFCVIAFGDPVPSALGFFLRCATLSTLVRLLLLPVTKIHSYKHSFRLLQSAISMKYICANRAWSTYWNKWPLKGRLWVAKAIRVYNNIHNAPTVRDWKIGHLRFIHIWFTHFVTIEARTCQYSKGRDFGSWTPPISKFFQLANIVKSWWLSKAKKTDDSYSESALARQHGHWQHSWRRWVSLSQVPYSCHTVRSSSPKVVSDIH